MEPSRYRRIGAAVLVVAGAWLAQPAAAQQTGSVQGEVRAADTGGPVVGAQVFVPGTGMGTLTNERGAFLLTAVPPGQVTIRVEIIGYATASQTVSVQAGASVRVDFSLEPRAVSLGEVVVTATGRQRRVELGNAVTTLQAAEEIEAAPVNSLTEYLTGRAAGVQIFQSGGTTGTGSRIRIRGANSVSLSNEPLVYVDGVRITRDANAISFETGGQAPSLLGYLDPEQIESIEIVKGPSAATLYGTEAANGVIRITTKRGAIQETRFNAYIEQGVLTQPDDVFPSNWRGVGADGEPCFLFDIAAGNCSQARLDSFNPLEDSRTRPFETGYRQQYGLSITGGREGFTYFLSGELEDEGGVTDVNDLRRVSLRANFGAQPAENLSVDVSTGYMSSDLGLPLNDNFALGFITNAMSGTASIDENSGFGEFTPEELFTIDTEQSVERFTGSVASTWNPLSFLEFRGTGGVDFVNRSDLQFFPTGRAPAFLGFDRGAKFFNQFRQFTYTLDLGASTKFDLSPTVSSRTSFGFQYFNELTEGTLAEGRDIVTGASSITAAATRISDEQTTQSITVGGFIEEQVSFNDRLFFTGAIRADDNSAFGEDFDVVIFPKLSGSWVVSEEDFFPASSTLSSLRLRAAWGGSGLQPGSTAALTFFTPVPGTVGGQSVTAVTFGGLGNPNLEPERSSEIEIGFDAGLFDSRLNVEFTGYNKETSDALVFRTLPPSLGVAQGRWENLGSVRNRGLEALVDWAVVENEALSWSLTFNGSVNDNELLELGEGIDPIIFGNQRHVEGFSTGGYWDLPIESFNDANGDGILEADEVVVGDTVEFLGNPFPTQQLSVGTSVGLLRGHVRISGLMEFRGGQELYNNTAAWRLGQNNTRSLNDPNAPLSEQARAVASKFLGTDAGYIEDASFWRLREISVTLSPPESWSRLFQGRDVSLSLTGRNLGVWTDYTGFDPEVSSEGQTNFSTFEFMTQPPVRRFSARLNVTF